MAENRVEANAHNAGGCPASNAIHGHINDFLVRTGLRSGVSELQLPCFTAVRAEIALMSGSAFAVTHHAFSSGAGRTSDGNGSHASTSKTPSYTKSVSWQHHPIFTVGAVVLATCLLSGCVNEQKVNQLASNVQTLNAKIARLEQDMKALRPQIYAAKSEANRANTRLDAQDYFDCLRCLRMYAE